MKFKINRDHFVNGLQKVQNLVGSRSLMPILNNVLIRAENGGISLTTTNLDIGIRCEVKAQVEEEGIISLPVKKLFSIVKSLPSIEVWFESTAQQAKISSGGASFKIMGINGEEFPAFPSVLDERLVEFEQGVLQEMIKKVSYSQSTDENRYLLNGIYFHFNEGKLCLVATDGRRLAFVGEGIAGGVEGASSFVLPAKTAMELERVLGLGEKVKIGFNNKQVVFEVGVSEEGQNDGFRGNVVLVSKVVEGSYPNYSQVIPKETVHRIKVDRQLLLETLGRASIVASDRSHAVKLAINNNLVEIKCSSPEFGESHESIAIEYGDKPVELAFNPQFLMDPLKALTQDEVYFEFKDELSPGVFKTLESFICVIMPLRLS